MDEYYFGLSNEIAPGAVHLIYDTVVRALQANHQRTFVVSEIAYFA